MKRIIILLSFVIVLILGFIIFGGKETQLIDVRTPEEYSSSHANGAINIPLATIKAGDFSRINKNASLKIYCRTGKRASEAKNILVKAGYKDVVNIGGLADWQSKGELVCKSTKPNC